MLGKQGKKIDSTFLQSISDLLYRRLFLIYLLLITALSLYIIHVFIPSDSIYLGDDLLFHVQRLKSLANALLNGTFPYYIDSESVSGYGYASKWFYSDFTLIPFGILANLTDIVVSYKILLFTLTLTCGITTFISINRILRSRYVAFLGGLLYTFCLYRMYDLFFRAAIGEVIAFTLVPLVIYGFYEIARGNYKRWYILSISFSLLLYSHLITSVLMVGTLVLFCLISYKSFIAIPKRFYFLILSSIVCLFLTSYFLFPFIEQVLSNTFYFNKYRTYFIQEYTLSGLNFILTLANETIFKDHFLFPSIGLILVIPQFLRFFIKKNITPFLRYADIFLVLGILYTITSLDIFPWDLFPFNRMNLIQFPNRFFLISSFFLAFSGSYYISVFSKNSTYRFFVLVVVILLLIQCNINFQNGVLNKIDRKGLLVAFAPENVGTGEYYPIKFSTDYLEENQDKVIPKNMTTDISCLEKKNGITSFQVNIQKPDTLEVPLLFYKGYSATLNNQSISLSESYNGLIEVPVNETGLVKVSFSGTFLQKYSLYLTLISFILLIAYIFLFRKKINS